MGSLWLSGDFDWFEYKSANQEYRYMTRTTQTQSLNQGLAFLDRVFEVKQTWTPRLL